MYIFIMRHGEAANIEGKDALRPLTENGIIEAEKMGLWLVKKPLVKLIKTYVSPYKRAIQSGNCVISIINKHDRNIDLKPEILDLITPSGNAKQVHDYIDGLFHSNIDFRGEGDSDLTPAMLLVSHMPFVSYLVGELTKSATMPIFSTGAIAIIDYHLESMKGKLIDIVLPESVRV